MAAKKRKRIFCGCEGAGEKALLVATARWCDDLDIPLHLEPYDTGGGSPFDIVKNSIKRRDRQQKTHGAFGGGSFIFLDNDRLHADGKSEQVRTMARQAGFKLVVQHPCLECLLGRLLCGDLSLGETRARSELRRAWPDYDKSFAASDVMKHLTIADIRLLRADDDWAAFMKAAGIIPPPAAA